MSFDVKDDEEDVRVLDTSENLIVLDNSHEFILNDEDDKGAKNLCQNH
jgi:hypothetical protein